MHTGFLGIVANHVVNCEEMKNLGSNVKLKNDKRKISHIIIVNWECKVL